MKTANIEIFVKIAALIKDQGITPTPEMVINLAIKTLVDSGMGVEIAFDFILGAGSFESLSDSIFQELNAA